MKAYLDYNASAPLLPEVADIMADYLKNHVGNPSSLHHFGRYALGLIEQAREQVADAIGALPEQVIFTSGATEANNMALKGFAWSQPAPGKIAIGATEHEAVTAPAALLAEQGWHLESLSVDTQGRLSEQEIAADLVSVMWANNETGVIQDIPKIVAASRHQVRCFHSDATQTLGKIPINFQASGLDMLSLSSHKIGGPMGVGALVVKAGTPLMPLIHGGGHQLGLRSGTENVPGIIGFGLACEQVTRALTMRQEKMRAHQQQLEAALQARDITIFAQEAPRLPNTTFFALPGIAGEMAVMELDKAGFAVSGGAACGTHKSEAASTVLMAMGIAPTLAECAVRVSIGPETEGSELDALLVAIDNLRKRYVV